MYNFDAVKVKNDLIQWIRDWFETNGKGCNAVIGLSGGKDSLIALVLCVEALGKDRVVAVAMPDGEQSENGAREIAEFYGVRYMVVNIGETVKAVKNSILSTNEFTEALSVQSQQNIPPRVRMTTLYAVSQSLNGRVSECCNFSENFIGYSTILVTLAATSLLFLTLPLLNYTPLPTRLVFQRRLLKSLMMVCHIRN